MKNNPIPAEQSDRASRGRRESMQESSRGQDYMRNSESRDQEHMDRSEGSGRSRKSEEDLILHDDDEAELDLPR